jgi:hypothetical protein
MKRCPTCQSTYTDDSLIFCLQDGARLAPADETPSARSVNATWILPETPASGRPDQAPTEAFNSGGAPTVRMPATAETVQERHRGTVRDVAPIVTTPIPTPEKKSNTLLIVGVTSIIVLLLALTGIGVALLLRDSGEQTGGVNSNNKNSETTNKQNDSTDKADNKNASTPPANSNTTNVSSSLKITATASSTRVPMKGNTYYPSHILDGSLLTAWIEGGGGPGLGEWIRCDFDREVKLNQITITPGYFKNPSIWKQNNRLAAATIFFSDDTSRRFTFPDRMQEQKLSIGGIRTRSVRLVIEEIYPGSVDSEDTAISQLSFDWEPSDKR